MANRPRCSVCGRPYNTADEAKACADLGTPWEWFFEVGDAFTTAYGGFVLVILARTPRVNGSYKKGTRKHIPGYSVVKIYVQPVGGERATRMWRSQDAIWGMKRIPPDLSEQNL